jgi:hypothetical protein
MAYTATTDKVVAEQQIQGYIAATLPEQLTLMQTGIVDVDLSGQSIAADVANGGNVFQMKGRVRDTAAWDTPTNDTAATVRTITSWSQKAVVHRRIKLYGNQDFASLAANESTGDWKQDLGRIASHNIGINTEKLIFQQLIKALYDTTSGVLRSTHLIDRSTLAFEEYMLGEGLELLGENGAILNTVIMHSSVYWKRRINTLLTEVPVPSMAVIDRENQATTYVGNIGRLRLYLNDRVQKTSDATPIYDTILAGPGALMYVNQLAESVEIFPRTTHGGGSDNIMYRLAASAAVPKVSFTGTVATDIIGATDAEIGTAGNWTYVTGAAVADTPLVVIKSKAS